MKRSDRLSGCTDEPRPAGPRATNLEPSGFLEQLDETITFIRLLWALDHSMRSASKEMRVNLGVSGPERLILRMVGLYTRLSPGDLARLLHLDPSSLTPALERLARRGLLARAADPRDGRRAILELTSAGRRIDRLRSGTIESRIRHTLASLRRSDIVATSRVLGALAAGFERSARNARAGTVRSRETRGRGSAGSRELLAGGERVRRP